MRPDLQPFDARAFRDAPGAFTTGDLRDEAPLEVTDAGRELALQAIAAVKAVESGLLDGLGAWESNGPKVARKRPVQGMAATVEAGAPCPARAEAA